MPYITEPAFYLVAIPAVIALGLSKGGFSGLGTVAVPLMALVISPVQAVGIITPILITQDVVTIWSYRRTWDAAIPVSPAASLTPGMFISVFSTSFGATFSARVLMMSSIRPTK